MYAHTQDNKIRTIHTYTPANIYTHREHRQTYMQHTEENREHNREQHTDTDTEQDTEQRTEYSTYDLHNIVLICTMNLHI